MTKKITIGLPIYNEEKFLRKRIENIQSQTLSDFDLIISNNSSTDSTHEICKEFLENKNNIKYFLQEKNKGAIWNFQFVLQKANTPYFVWAGADDIWDKNFLQENVNFLELSGICNNAIEALEELNKNHIDLLFLDINMPKISGLTFYKSLKNPPDVIFTTAYSEHAIDGFELNATDYLLKPFSFDRFFTAVNKVVEKKHSNNKINNNDYLLIKANKITHKIATNDILFIEAYGDYVKVHIEDKYILTNSTFTNIFNQLPKNIFFRTHKSFAINLDKIDTINGNRISITTHLVPIGQKFKREFLKSLNRS